MSTRAIYRRTIRRMLKARQERAAYILLAGSTDLRELAHGPDTAVDLIAHTQRWIDAYHDCAVAFFGYQTAQRLTQAAERLYLQWLGTHHHGEQPCTTSPTSNGTGSAASSNGNKRATSRASSRRRS